MNITIFPEAEEQLGTHVRFYWRKGKRYWTRQANQIREIIIGYSKPEVTRAVGHQAEMLFDAALDTVGSGQASARESVSRIVKKKSAKPILNFPKMLRNERPRCKILDSCRLELRTMSEGFAGIVSNQSR